MSTAAATQPWTTEEFLEWERQQEVRHEFDGYRAIAMTGGRIRHARVIGNLRDAIRDRLPAGCEVFNESLKLRCGQSIRYPDVIVVCHPIEDIDTDILDQAAIVVEVLSPSSVRTDRVEKVSDYASVSSVQRYLIVDPAARDVTLYSRQGAQLLPADGADPLDLGHGIELTFDDIYENVT